MTLTCGIYARISLDQAGEGLGVARQVQDCTAKAKALGWTVGDTYTDNDVSATKNVPRPEYTRLLADLEAGTITGVVVYDLDRLTRRPADLEAFIDLSDRLGVSLANVSGDVDLTTAAGRMVARIKGAVARQEAERIGERVKRQKRQRAEQGLPQGGRHRLYGYDRGWQVVEEEAAVIREAFMRRAAGESTTSIANDLKKRGFKTVAGKDWQSRTLAKTLTKHVYCGLATFKGEVIGKSVVPALIDEDTFNAAQANLANDSAGTNTRRYLLSGILLCKHCLSPMKGNPSSHMYRCSTTYGGCGRLSVRIALADRWITWAAMERATMQSSTKPQVRDFDQEAKAIEATISRLQDGYKEGVYTLAEASPLIKAERTRLKEVVKAKAKARPRMNAVTQRHFDFNGMNLSQKRAFITEHITNVVVGPSISRGHQPFNPARFECHYPDGTSEVLSGVMDEEDL